MSVATLQAQVGVDKTNFGRGMRSAEGNFNGLPLLPLGFGGGPSLSMGYFEYFSATRATSRRSPSRRRSLTVSSVTGRRGGSSTSRIVHPWSSS